MSCYKHLGRESVATCNSCGRELCSECAQKIHPPMCVDCAVEYSNEVKKTMIFNIAISVVLMIVGIVVIKSPAGIMLAGIPYGWSILNRITPSMFLWMSWVGWLIYFGIKLVIAYFIGIIALPIKLVGWISDLVRVNKILNGVAE